MTPSAGMADYLITAFDEAHYPVNPENGFGGFTWGDFTYSGVVTDGPSSLTIDATNRDGANNIAGGIGVDYPMHNFDPGLAEWEVRFRILSNNQATAFRTTYRDDDGPGTVSNRRGTEYVFDFNISGLDANQWHVLSKPFTDVAFRQTAFQHDAGDGIQNPGLNQIQLQSVFNSTNRLNVEFDYVAMAGLVSLVARRRGAGRGLA